MEKNFFDKLRKNKMRKTVFTLSLALALLLSSIKPLEVKADEVEVEGIIPSYSDLVDGCYAYIMFNHSNAGKCLAVFDTPVDAYDQKMHYYVSVSSSWYVWTKLYITKKDTVTSSFDGEYYPERLYILTDGEWVDAKTKKEYYSEQTYYNMIVKGTDDWGYTVHTIELLDVSYDYDIYKYTTKDGVETLLDKPVKTYGNATEDMWNAFADSTADVIGYKYASANGVDWSGWIWKEVRFDKDVYPYWDIDSDGVRRLMVYVPLGTTYYMTKDLGFYDNHGVYDYYIHTIEYTDEYVLQPYIWYEDYYPDIENSDKNYCLMEFPYAVDYMDGYAIDEKTTLTVYDSKEDAILAYHNDYDIIVTPTPNPNPSIAPEPLPDPLPPTDDSESMGFIDFIKQFENLFNASGNLWKIMYYCFAFLPQQILWCLWSAVQIFLAVMVIKWIRE